MPKTTEIDRQKSAFPSALFTNQEAAIVVMVKNLVNIHNIVNCKIYIDGELYDKKQGIAQPNGYISFIFPVKFTEPGIYDIKIKVWGIWENEPK